MIQKKTHRTKKDFRQFLTFLKLKIKFIPEKQIIPFLEQAKEISPDPKDIVYIALALMLNAHIRSNDKRLRKFQNQINILTTAKIKDQLDFQGK